MKRYICIFIVVTGAAMFQGKGSWSISNNFLSVTIDASGK